MAPLGDAADRADSFRRDPARDRLARSAGSPCLSRHGSASGRSADHRRYAQPGPSLQEGRARGAVAGDGAARGHDAGPVARCIYAGRKPDRGIGGAGGPATGLATDHPSSSPYPADPGTRPGGPAGGRLDRPRRLCRRRGRRGGRADNAAVCLPGAGGGDAGHRQCAAAQPLSAPPIGGDGGDRTGDHGRAAGATDADRRR